MEDFMKKRLTAILLLIAMLASCGTTTVPDETNASDSSADVVSAETESDIPEETAEPSGLPDMNWDGREFRVLGFENTTYTQFSNFEIDSDGETGEVVNDAVFRRNTALEDKYGVEIVQTLDSSTTDNDAATREQIRTAVNAGEDLYDLVFTTMKSSGTLAREGMFYNMNNVEYINFTKNWWNQGVNDVLEISDRLYFTNSDFSLRDKSRTYILVYNKNLVDQNNLGDPFQLVREGKWTIDTMTEWAKAVGKDVNGNGQVDFDDRFGVAFDSYNGFRTFAFGCGAEIIKNNNGAMELVLNSERTVDIIDKVLAFFTQDYVGTTCEVWDGKVGFDKWGVASRLFKEGRLLFAITFPHTLAGYSAECVDDYGILPLGKYDEEQEKHYTYADSFSMLFGIPSSTPAPEFSGFMIEALSHASQTTTLPAYYEITCKTKYTYDPQSAEMLDLIFDGIVFDPAMIYNVEGASTIFTDIAKSGKNNFASSYKQIEKKAKVSISRIVKDIESFE